MASTKYKIALVETALCLAHTNINVITRHKAIDGTLLCHLFYNLIKKKFFSGLHRIKDSLKA